jgi:hypothetical protein
MLCLETSFTRLKSSQRLFLRSRYSRGSHNLWRPFSSSPPIVVPSEKDGTSSKLFYTPTQKQVMSKCKDFHTSIMPLNQRLRGPLAPHSDRGTALPFVLLVGNHSSGKSSFINYVLGKKIQTTGVAPTDDGKCTVKDSHTVRTPRRKLKHTPLCLPFSLYHHRSWSC